MSNSLNVIEYLADKINSKLQNIRNTKTLISDVKSFDDFRYQKQYILQGILDVEDDMKQSSQALRILLKQNQDLIDQIKTLESDLQKYNMRLMSADKYQIELNKKIQEINLDRGNLKEKERSYIEKISQLQQAVKDEKRISQTLANSMVDRVDTTNSKDKNEKGREKEEVSKNTNLSSNLSPIPKKDVRSSGKDDEDYDEYKDESKDLKNLIDYRLKNRRIVNDVVMEHLHKPSFISVREEDGTQVSYRYTDEEDDFRLDTKESKEASKKYENKPQKVSDIVLKMNNNKDVMVGIMRKFGKGVFQKLFSGDLEDEFLSQVEREINYLEKGQNKSSLTKSTELETSATKSKDEKMKSILGTEIAEVKEEHEEDLVRASEIKNNNFGITNSSGISKGSQQQLKGFGSTDSELLSPKTQSVKKTSFVSEGSNKPFENSLRKYTENDGNNSRRRAEEKKVWGYGRSYGSYFDESLRSDGGIMVDSSEVNVRLLSPKLKKTLTTESSLISLHSKSKSSLTKPELDQDHKKIYYKRDYYNGWKNTKEFFDQNDGAFDIERLKSSDKIVNKMNI